MRPLRLHVPGGFYHVTLRGNHRRPIFFSDADRDILDCIVAEALDKAGARLHAYCWMTNHLHFLVQVAEVALGRLLLRIAARYARKIQSGMQTTGHFFERRYYGVLVDADSYLLTLLRYIHANPVVAGIVSDAADYPWSSHRNYLGLRYQAWVTTEFALGVLSRNRVTARRLYGELMENREALLWGQGELQTHPDNNQVLGSDDFLMRATQCSKVRQPRISFEQLMEECASRFDVSANDLVSPRRDRRLSAARAWLCHEALSRKVDSVNGIARRLGRSDTAIRRLLERRKLKLA